MSSPAQVARVPVERFERLYEESADPWGYRTSAYEHEKYAATLDALGLRTFARALEVGCSIGVFTRLLAPRCEQLLAVDYSPRALELAAQHVRDLPHVELGLATFPEQAPEGPWDLVVCSELLYYLDRPALARAMAWLEAQLADGASVLAVSWRGEGVTEPLRGDWVHDLLERDFARWHVLDARRAAYRLDLFAADGREPIARGAPAP